MRKNIFERFKEKWGDRFDYSDAKFTGYKEKMHIFCKKHNQWFWQTPDTHLRFFGCKECSKELKSSIRRLNKEEFLDRCHKLYGDTYDLSEAEYINNSTNFDIICPKHGKVSVNPLYFFDGKGCPLCAKENRVGKNRLPFSEVLRKFRLVHGDKYEYDESTYQMSETKMRMICPIHGEFWKSPNKHSSGQGCPKCSKENKNCGMSLSDFVDKAKSIHGDKYDYSQTVFTKTTEKTNIICHVKDENGIEHGEFIQNAESHLQGNGCPKCAQIVRNQKSTKSFDVFLEAAKKIQEGKGFEYDKSTYRNLNTEMRIICPKHGEFWQKPNKHLRGHGCPKCAKSGIHFSQEEYIERARDVHGDKYNYDEIDFQRTKDKIKIICPKHGPFFQEAQSHLNGAGCPKCANNISVAETEISNFFKSFFGEDGVVERDRTILDNKEIDILVPSIRLGVEYNGLYWHSEKYGKGKYTHIDKTDLAKKKGINLIQIFEDEWVFRKDVVLSKLKHIIGKDYDLPKIMARKCTIREIDSTQSKPFLEENHIQGKAYATVHLGAFYGDELIAVMLFKKDGIKEDHWELNRFCSKISYLCQGVGSKLFSYFIKTYDPSYVKSFADRRWTINTDNNLYTKLNFKLDSILEPDYRYFLKSKIERIHKFNFRKQILHRKYGFDLSMTENKMSEQLNAYKIWDCGLFKYVWTKQ